MLGVGKDRLNDRMKRQQEKSRNRVYPTDNERSLSAINSRDEHRRNLEKIARDLLSPRVDGKVLGDSFELRVTTLYKNKATKVRPVDANDGTGAGPGGRHDWYQRSKDRDKPQPQAGKYREHLIPRFSSLPRGSRITPERLKKLNVGDWLLPDEREMFDEVMVNREEAIGFDWKDIRKIHEDVSPPIKIKTIPHKAWQEKNFPCPRALIPVVVKMLLERLERGVLEKCSGPYRNPWFLVAKKAAGTYRLINAAMKMNSVTLRDANLPPSVDEFSEEFAGCQVASLIDFFSGYDQLDLDVRSRDMTAFMTPLGLLRMTTPPQGATNSVAQFVRVVMTILEDLFPGVAMPFMDDIGVKGPYSDYGGEMTLPGIRRFVYEHIRNLDKTLERIERAQATIGEKSQFCQNGMVVVGFVTGSAGRSPSSAAIVKILNWERCNDLTESKAFLGICVYYRIWIKNFAGIAEPIYFLSKKGVEFHWEEAQAKAMRILKNALTSAPILCKVHYNGEDGWGVIILTTDASFLGWGAVLQQLDPNGRRRVARYESGLWNNAEKGYDAGKRECRGVLKALQKLRFWLYGTHFRLETDANTLVAQLSRASTDLPGALVTRWIAWIQLFDFEVVHVKGSRNTAADGLSRRPRQPKDSGHDEDTDIDEFIALELNALDIPLIRGDNKQPSSQPSSSQSGRNASKKGRHTDNLRGRNQESILPPKADENIRDPTPPLHADLCLCVYTTTMEEKDVNASQIRVDAGLEASQSQGEDPADLSSRAALESRASPNSPLSRALDHPGLDEEATSLDPLTDKYGEYYQNIARYLITLKKPEGMDRKQFQQLRREACKFGVRNRRLWRNFTKGYPPRLVLDDPEDKHNVIIELHDRAGHAGRENTFARVANRYFWTGCYDDIRRYVASCTPCQRKLKNRMEEALYPTQSAPLFHRLAIDCIAFPICRDKNKLVVARCDFSGWPEAVAMKNPTAEKVAKWVFEDIICRHGLVGELKVDGGAEFKGEELVEMLKKYEIKRLVISPYNAKGNGGIERGHQAFISALLTLTDGGKRPWIDLLPWVLFAERTTIHGPTGHTPFYMVYGREAVLPIETKYPTWRTLGWDEVVDRETLLMLRTKQIMMRDEDIEESRLRKDRRRRESKEYFDDHHQIRTEPLKEMDLVLVYDIQHMDVDKSSSTKLQWRWLGPYRVRRAHQLKGYYLLEELDGTPVHRSYQANRLKRFVKREGYWYSPEDKVEPLPIEPDAPNLNELEEREATSRYYTRHTASAGDQQTQAIVEVPGLPESERSKYTIFPEESDTSVAEDMREST